ncbi:MAG: efflux RND transporter periplasmic adaptor subunit [Lentisphaeria bacterium]|nr:efflux RND transporter periplasmic adaptor subunit [Lentisphaeria bacterium]
MKKFYSVIAGCMLACSTLMGAAERPPEMVNVDKVKLIDASIKKRYIGTLISALDVSLVPRISGIIEKKLFENGDLVKKGQLLFQLEDTTYRAQLAAAKAKVEQCQAEFNFASANLKRVTTLRKQNAVSESAYDEAVRLEGTSKAALAAAKASLIDAENNLSYTRIVSPIDGRVGKAVLSDFNYVTPSTGSLVTVVSTTPMYLNFSISARDFYKYFGSIENIRKSAKITFELADGTLYNEAAFHILLPENRIDKKTDTVLIRGYFNNPELKLLPDSLVTTYLSRSIGKKQTVPPTAILNDSKGNYVLVVGKDNMVSRRNVTVGDLVGGQQIIESGLATGEVVVVDGTHKARPGAKIVPVYPKAEKK